MLVSTSWLRGDHHAKVFTPGRKWRRPWVATWVATWPTTRRPMHAWLPNTYYYSVHIILKVIFLQLEDPQEFRGMKRMTEDTFKYLLRWITPRISKKKTKFRPTISANVRLTIFLHYLAYRGSRVALTHDFWIGRNTVHGIVHACAKAIVEELMEEYIKVCRQAQTLFNLCASCLLKLGRLWEWIK